MTNSEALIAGGTFNPITCPGRDVTRDEVVEVLLECADDNEGILESEEAVHGVMRAVSI